MDYEARIEELLAKGFCCAEAIVRLGLDLREEENEQLACAASALCRGMHSGCNCGALAGGALLLSMFDKAAAADSMIPELVAWFDKGYGMEYGSIDCRDIAGERMQHRAQRCKPIIIAVCGECVELLKAKSLL
jgi:hypothetical protein